MKKKQKKFIRKAIAQFHEEGAPSDAHILPIEEQPWHQPAPWCFCMPEVIDENPMTGHKLWVHRVIVH
jgi:hypothetical protein